MSFSNVLFYVVPPWSVGTIMQCPDLQNRILLVIFVAHPLLCTTSHFVCLSWPSIILSNAEQATQLRRSSFFPNLSSKHEDHQ